MTLRGGLPVVGAATVPCKEAGEALRYAFLGLFCFGFILGPVAITKALKAKRMIEVDPMMSGWGKANAALIVGIIASVMNVMLILAGMTAANRR